MPSKTFIVLAKSTKNKNFCVAGKLFDNNIVGGWIRPVNPENPTGDALSITDMEYSSKQKPELFHIVSFSYLRNVKHDVQIENYSIDTQFYWQKLGVFPKNKIESLLDHPYTLWHNNYSTYNGLNDRFDKGLVGNPIQSLYFIHVKNLDIRIKKEGANFGNDLRRYRGFFTYNGIDYGIMITDPQIYSDFGRHAEGTYGIGSCYITLSTAPHTDGFCYKFIAAIIR